MKAVCYTSNNVAKCGCAMTVDVLCADTYASTLPATLFDPTSKCRFSRLAKLYAAKTIASVVVPTTYNKA